MEHAITALDFRRLSGFPLEHRGARAIRATALAVAMAIAGSAFGQPTQVQPEAQSFRLGGLQFSALRDSQNAIDNDGEIIGVEAGPAAVSATLEHAGASQDKVTLDIDALLVQAPGRVMLFDTGLGPHAHGALMGNLMLEHDCRTRRLKWQHWRAADLVDNESPFVPISWLTRVVRLGVPLNRA